MLPTTRPYLLDEVFPHLLHGIAPPHSPDVWELSRFAAMDFSVQASSALAQFSSPIAVGLPSRPPRFAAAPHWPLIPPTSP